MAKRKLRTKSASFIDPDRLYTMRGFMQAAGLSRTRMADAKFDHGITVETLDIGVLRYVRGRDGIDYIERLAEALKK